MLTFLSFLKEPTGIIWKMSIVDMYIHPLPWMFKNLKLKQKKNKKAESRF